MTSTQTADRKRRPRRIAADEAHAWARNLRLGNPYAKLVLSMLTIYVNGEGSCFVSIAQLAEDCELAENTVRRRLTYLEQIGAIAKFPQWRDEHGRMNGEGRGRRTTDDIRLLISADPDDIEARAIGGNSDAETDDDTGDSTTGRGAGGEPLDQSQESVSPSLGVQRPSHCGQGLISEPEPESPPKSPSGGGEPLPVNGLKEDRTWPGCDTWPEFEKAWQEPILRQSLAQQVWSALKAEERLIAIKAAAGYMRWRLLQKKPPNIINAHTFLRETDAWAGFVKHAPVETPPPVFIALDSPEWLARCVVRHILGDPPPVAKAVPDFGMGAMIAVPQSPDLTALSQFAATDGAIADDGWIVAREATPQFFAWSKRIFEWTGRRPAVSPSIAGVLVPCEWPPRKDGTLYTGPPEQQQAG